jgi:NodT family efflux transporter outer membrane factor (OMF) lipoprotein
VSFFPRFILISAVLTGCAVHEVTPTPAPLVLAPERFSGEGGEAPTVDRWWTTFGSGELDALIDEAIGHNLDLRRAVARVRQAEAVLAGADASTLPSLQAQAGVGGARTVLNLGPPIGVRSNEAATFSLGVSAAWEVDLWGRIAHQVDAARLDVEATRADVSAAAQSLAARIADAYLQVLGEQALLGLLENQEKLSRDLVALYEARLAQGLGTTLEVHQQRQQLASIMAQRPLAEARRALQSQQLAVLLGRVPSALAVSPLPMPTPPPPPQTGLPAEVLLRRPDVRAAMVRVTAADHRVGQAIAARYPALSLSGSTGFQSPDLLDLFGRWVWNLASNLVAPLFDGGRREAEVARTEAVLTELVNAYGQSVLTALAEVEGALVQEQRQREHLAALESQLEFARLAYTEADRRFREGLASHLEALTAQRSVQQSELALLSAKRQQLAYRVQLHRALGGAWSDSLPSE